MSIIGGMASIPERVESLRLAVESILPHVDSLHIALNEYTSFPEFVDRANCYPELTTNGRGDAEKFFCFNPAHTWMSFDDDLTYTPEYFKTMFAAMNDRPGIISLHGRRLTKPFTSYYRSAEKFHCLRPQQNWERVDFGGTGVMVIPAGTLKMSMEDFPVANMADVWVGILAKAQGVPIWVPPHTGKEVRHNDIDLRKTIYASMHPEELDQVVREGFIERRIGVRIYTHKQLNAMDGVIISTLGDYCEGPYYVEVDGEVIETGMLVKVDDYQPCKQIPNARRD